MNLTLPTVIQAFEQEGTLLCIVAQGQFGAPERTQLLNNASNVCELGFVIYKTGLVLPLSLNGLMCVVL